MVPLSPAEPLSIAVARLAKGGSSQSGTTSSNPPSSSGSQVRTRHQAEYRLWVQKGDDRRNAAKPLTDSLGPLLSLQRPLGSVHLGLAR